MKKQCPTPAGILVIIGGKEDKGNGEQDGKEKSKSYIHLEVLKAFVELTGKKNPVIEVITSTDKKPISIRDLKVHILSCGDLYTIPQLNPPHK